MWFLLLALAFVGFNLWLVWGKDPPQWDEERARAKAKAPFDPDEERQRALIREEGRLAARREAKQAERAVRDTAFERRVQAEVERRLGRAKEKDDDNRTGALPTSVSAPPTSNGKVKIRQFRADANDNRK